MSDTGQRSDPSSDAPAPEVGSDTLLGQPVLRVNYGELRIDARIASILGLKEDDVLPDPVEEDEAAAAARPQLPIDVRLLKMEVRPRRRVGRVVAIGLALVGLLWAVQYRQLWSREVVAAPPLPAPSATKTPRTTTSPKPPPRLPVRVLADELGRPLSVAGPDPARTLAGFCASGLHAGRLRPLGVAPAPPPARGLMLGHYEDLSDSTGPLAVRIFLDPRDGRWRIGDGRTPIRGKRVPPGSAPRAFGAQGPPPFELVIDRSPAERSGDAAGG